MAADEAPHASPSATPTADTNAPFECAPVSASPRDAEAAEVLRLVFDAVIRGEAPEHAEVDLDSPVLALARETRACPRSFARGFSLDEQLVELSGPLGTLPLQLDRRHGRGAVGWRLWLEETERALEARRDAASLREWLDARPTARPVYVSAYYASIVMVREPGAASLCVLPRDSEPREDQRAPPRCFRTTEVGRAAVGGAPDPPYDDEEPEDTTRVFRPFVELDGATFELLDEGLVPRRAPRDLHWARDGTIRRETVRHAFESVDSETIPWEAIQRTSLFALGDACVGGARLLCCQIDTRWRCADAAARLSIARGDDAPLAAADGTITLTTLRCDGGSELSECVELLHVLHAEGTALVHDGSIAIGARWVEHMREWQDHPRRGREVIGAHDVVSWRPLVRSGRCVELTHVEREIGSHHIFYPERGRPVHRARERRARAPVDLGDPVDTLPRFPDREESFDLVHAGSATLNLRGSYLLGPDGWRRVASCP